MTWPKVSTCRLLELGYPISAFLNVPSLGPSESLGHGQDHRAALRSEVYTCRWYPVARSRTTSRDGIVKVISVVLLFAFLASTVQEGRRQSPWLRSSDVCVCSANTRKPSSTRPAAPSSVHRQNEARRLCPREL